MTTIEQISDPEFCKYLMGRKINLCTLEKQSKDSGVFERCTTVIVIVGQFTRQLLSLAELALVCSN